MESRPYLMCSSQVFWHQMRTYYPQMSRLLEILRKKFYVEVVLGFTRINYIFDHHFVSLELFTIHRRLLQTLLKDSMWCSQHSDIALVWRMPMTLSVSSLHWEQIHVVSLLQYEHLFWLAWLKTLFPYPFSFPGLFHLFLFGVKWGPKPLAMDLFLASTSSLAWRIASYISLATHLFSIISSANLQKNSSGDSLLAVQPLCKRKASTTHIPKMERLTCWL